MSFSAHFSFYFRNYLRSHRYLREIVVILIFHVFFWGFLYSAKPDDAVWTVFGVLGIILNMVTVPSVFFLEKGNSLYFGLVRPAGRLHFFFAKILLIFLIDFFWIVLFTFIYGIRFLDGHYFLLWIPRLAFTAYLLILSISILSISFTYKPWTAWVLFALLIFGGILNKSVLFPPSLRDAYVLFTVILPPVLEIIYSAWTLQFPLWRILFLLIAGVQIGFYFYLNAKLILRRDFI